MELNQLVEVSPGFKTAVNLEQELDNLEKVSGFIPTEVSHEVFWDFAKKLHPTAEGQRSRLIMGTYGTGKSHLALVLANLLRHSPGDPRIQTVLDKMDPDTRKTLEINRKALDKRYLIVTLYGEMGRISDAFMMGLRRALDRAGLTEVLPESAFDAALSRIQEVKERFPENFKLLEQAVEARHYTLSELQTRLESYDRGAFELFCDIHPSFSGGSRFVYSTMLDPGRFYQSVAQTLATDHGYAGIAVFWDEFGHKMEDVVKDPAGREGLELQEFAECCNNSEEHQLHLYLFCHRSLKEYQDVTKSVLGLQEGEKQREDDLRKIEGRFRAFTMATSDRESFQLINAVIIQKGKEELTRQFEPYFNRLAEETRELKYFSGFSSEELKSQVILGAFPLHPLAVFSLPELSEKVAQNNRTLFTCLCEDEIGSLNRFLQKTPYDPDASSPPIFTVDRLWDYFATDVRQNEQQSSVHRDFEKLRARLDGEDELALKLLKTVSVFRVIKPSRFKADARILKHALDIPDSEQEEFERTIERISDHRDENRVLMRMSDGSYRTALSNASESVKLKVKRLLKENNSPLKQPVAYLNTIWEDFPGPKTLEAREYWDEYGITRQLEVMPVSLYQLQNSLHLLTKNLRDGEYLDGVMLVAMCGNSQNIKEAQEIAMNELASEAQAIVAIPTQPIEFFQSVREHQALAYLQKEEPHLYSKEGELYEEWRVWQEDCEKELKEGLEKLFDPTQEALEYYWKGRLRPDIRNDRKLKKLVNQLMRDVFPNCPQIGDDKLAQDKFAGNWGYRKECKDICLKLTRHEAAKDLYDETAAAQKHVITGLLKSNGILSKNPAGEAVIQKPNKEDHPGAARTWECINEFIERSKKSPVEMKKLVKKLRQPPFGLKCRAMPVFFAAAAHRELALGNLSFEYRRGQNFQKVTAIESDTLEKVFINPEKYRLIYINVSSDQKELISALANVFSADISKAFLPLERVNAVGAAIADWWRALPGHAQKTEAIWDGSRIMRDHVFRPLARIDADAEQILLKDIFEHVFTVQGKTIKRNQVIKKVNPIREEFETAAQRLHEKLFAVFQSVFGKKGEQSQDGTASLSQWFAGLDSERQNYVFNGDPAVLLNQCRKETAISPETLVAIAEKMTGMELESWADEMVLKFEGKLDSAKKYVENYSPPLPPVSESATPYSPISEDQVKLILMNNSNGNQERIFKLNQELSDNGQIMVNMLNATVDQMGRSLDEQERMQVFYRFIQKHIFEISEK